MDYISALVTITGTAALSQSRMHEEPKLEGESPDDYDQRTWRSKMHVEGALWAYPYPDKSAGSMVIPSMAFQRCLIEGAKFSKKKITGHQNSTWTKRFESGISVVTNGNLHIDPTTVACIPLLMNADGKRGSGRRVVRRLPQISPGWEAQFELMILDPMIIEDVFAEMAEYSGLFNGLGQFRPGTGGNNGRFVLKALDWRDNRRMIKK